MKHIQKRLFLGNLPPKLSKRDVVNKLQEFGNVQSVEMKQRTDDEGNILSSFAFVDIEIDTEKLYSCFRRFQSESWGDHKIKVEVARESFLDRLKREQEEVKRSNSKMKNNDVNGNLDQNHSQGMTDTIANENHVQTKNHSAPSVTSKEEVEKKSSKAKKLCKDTKPKHMSADDDIVQSKLEKSDDLDVVAASHEKRTRKRFGVMNMFSGTKNSKNVDDSQSNVEGDSKKDSSQVTETKIKEEEYKERKFHGCLSMFSGTRNLRDINDNDERNNYSKKRSGDVLSSPAKKHKSESFSKSEISSHQIVNNDTSNEAAAGKKVLSKGKDGDQSRNDLVEKKKKRSKNDKKAEEKRLNALEERNKAIHLRKEAVKKALSSVDTKTNSNKIIFDDEDSDDGEKSTSGDKPTTEQIVGSSKPKLFGDSSDDEDLKDMEQKEFKIKPQFEGPKGQKLLEMQSRYGNDTRFNLDERFLDSDEETRPEGEEEDGDGKEEDLNAEKVRQLSILQEMLGIDVSTKPSRKEIPEKRKSVQMVRFDPTNPEHSKYLVKEVEKEQDKKKEAEKEDKKSKKKKKGEAENLEEEGKVPTSTERFYEVSDLLKESLRKRTEKSDDTNNDDGEASKGFSLLKAFGSAPSDSEKEEEEVESYSTRPIKGVLHEWDKNPFKYDSSDDEEEENKVPLDSKESTSDKVSETPKAGDPSSSAIERFHLREDDPRLEEGLAFFRVNKTFEEMKEGFQEKRTDLKSIIKAKLKNNKKRKFPFKKKLGGLRRKFPKGRR